MSAAPGPSPGATTAELQFEIDDHHGEVRPVEILGRADRRDSYRVRFLNRTPWVITVRPEHLYILPNAPERSAS